MALALRGDLTLSGCPRLGRLCFVAGKTQLLVGIIMVALLVGETAPRPHAALGPWHPEVQQPKALLVVQSAMGLRGSRPLLGWPFSLRSRIICIRAAPRNELRICCSTARPRAPCVLACLAACFVRFIAFGGHPLKLERC